MEKAKICTDILKRSDKLKVFKEGVEYTGVLEPEKAMSGGM